MEVFNLDFLMEVFNLDFLGKGVREAGDVVSYLPD